MFKNERFSTRKKSKFYMFKICIFYFVIGFILNSYLLFNGCLDNISTKITRLLNYDLIQTNVVKYKMLKRVEGK